MDKKSFEEGIVVGALLAAQNTEGGGVVMTDTLKIIDEAPVVATVSFSDNGWKMVLKKVDGLHQDSYLYSRKDKDSTDWHLGKLNSSYALLALCVYYSNTLKWVGEAKYEWLLQSNNYKWGDGLFWRYQQVKWGVAVESGDEIHFVDNVFRLTNLTPLLPSSTSLYASAGIQATYLYDEQITDYNPDGTVSGVRYNRNLTKATGYWYTNIVKNEYLPDPENFERDYTDFLNAVIAYVNK
nr:MAG TPA: hypothetical protein [Caudoviricetes sp.]